MSTNGVELDGYDYHGTCIRFLFCRVFVGFLTGFLLIDSYRGCAPPAAWNSCAYPVESQDSMSVPTMAFGTGGDAQLVRDAARAEVCSEATSGWACRSMKK